MQAPQSVFTSDGGGGGVDAVVASELVLDEPDESEAGADDADAAVAGVPDAAGSSELTAAELSVAGVCGGLDSPPPHASQANGPEAKTTRATMGRR
jgi:hypothetical protein